MAYMVYTLYELINRNAFKLYFRDKKMESRCRSPIAICLISVE